MRPGGRRAATPATLLVSLLPLAFTAEGFLPRQTLAPTRLFVGVAPWADPDLVSTVRAGSGPSNPVLLDPASQMIPWSRAAREDLLFNPAQGAGAALLGNGQSAALFPTEAVSRWLAPFRAVTYSQAARLLLASWGVFLLIRILGFGELAACAAPLVFVGSGFVQLWRLHPHSLVAATAPWIVAGALALWRRPGARPAVLLAIAGAAGVAAGHPETLLHVAIFTLLALWGLAHFGGASGVAPSRAKARLLWSLACALLATLLAAPVLFPFIETLRVSAEWIDRRPQGRTYVEIPLRDALERLRPAGALHALGDPLDGTWRGPENLAELGGAATGGAALFLATLGLIAPTGGARARVARCSIAAIGLVGLLVGAHMPIVSAPFGSIPLLEDSLLKRLALWWVLAVVLLAAAGTQVLVEAAARRRPRLLAVAAGAAITTAVAVALAIQGSPAGVQARLWRLEVLPIAAALAAGMIAAGSSRRLAGVALLLAALLVPRLVLFDGWVPTTSPDAFYFGTKAVQFLDDRLGALPQLGFRVTGLEAALTPHSGAFFGLEEIRSYDPMTFYAYERFLGATVAPAQNAWWRVIDPGLPVLALLGVRFVIEDPPPPLPSDRAAAANAKGGLIMRREAFEQRGLVLAYEDTDAVIWERRDALPRVFFPRAWQVVDPVAALDETASIEDYAAMAVVDRSPEPPAVGENLPDPSARVLELDVGHGAIRTEVESATSHLLATSQPAIPGWRLTLDGEHAPERLRLVNTAFLGVAVPPGRHRIELLFAPRSWTLGLLLASVGAIAAVALLLADRGARTPRPPSRALRRQRVSALLGMTLAPRTARE